MPKSSLALLATFAATCLVAASPAQSWVVTLSGTTLNVEYGSGSSYPQYLAMDLSSSYYRLNTGPGCGWGTSVVLWPSYWSKGVLYQGGPVSHAQWKTSGSQLILTLTGKVGGLSCSATMTVNPPVTHTFSVTVSESNTGSIVVDSRPDEGFKTVLLSAMQTSSTTWDSYNLLTDVGLSWYPASGRINSAQMSKKILVTGGNSNWKINAPTMAIALDKARPVTGWVTASTNANNDNVGIWAASISNVVERSYSYTATATSN